MSVETIHIEGRRWFDRQYGNTYHSVRAYVNGTLVFVGPFQYGYGDQYVQTAMEGLVPILEANGIRMRYGPDDQYIRPLHHLRDDEGIITSTGVRDGLKRDCVAWGEPDDA